MNSCGLIQILKCCDLLLVGQIWDTVYFSIDLTHKGLETHIVDKLQIKQLLQTSWCSPHFDQMDASSPSGEI